MMMIAQIPTTTPIAQPILDHVVLVDFKLLVPLKIRYRSIISWRRSSKGVLGAEAYNPTSPKQGHKRNIFQRGQNHFSWFFPDVKYFFPVENSHFGRPKTNFTGFEKWKGKIFKKNALCMRRCLLCSSNMSVTHSALAFTRANHTTPAPSIKLYEIASYCLFHSHAQIVSFTDSMMWTGV